MERPDRFDPYRVLGVPPGAPIEDVKAAYRRLAKRHHPDAAGAGELARFLTVQAAYETIVRGRGAAARGASGAGRPGGAQPSAAHGSQSDPGRDWYAAAREAARARSRAGRRGTGPRARGRGAAGPGATGPGPGAATGTGADQAGAPHAGTGHAAPGARPGRAGRAADDARRDARRRRATLGSTTYDDVPAETPAWDGSAWYGAASGTYWTVNPREYADPRKHGPEYLGRATEWTGDRPQPTSSARDAGAAPGARDGTTAGPDTGARASAGGRGSRPGTRGAPEPGDRRPRHAPDASVRTRRAAGIAAAVLSLLGRRGGADRRVG